MAEQLRLYSGFGGEGNRDIGGAPRVLTLDEYRNSSHVFQDISLPQRGLQVPDIKQIYGEQGLWKEISVGVVGRTNNALQVKFAQDLLTSFTEQGHHTYTESPNGKLEAPSNINILVAHINTPIDNRQLNERIPDDKEYIALQVKDKFGLRKAPGHLVGITTIRERLSEMSHEEVVFNARRFMFRKGVPSGLFLTQDQSGNLLEVTLVTPEGGAISVPFNNYEKALKEIRDSLLTLEMAEDLPTKEDRAIPFPPDEFENSIFTKIMIDTGNRFNELGVLRPPIKASEHTKVPFKLTALRLYLGSQQWAEAAWIVADPEGSMVPNVGSIYMSATGGDGADKRAMTESDVVPVGEMVNGTLQVFPVPGKNTRKRSVEAIELSKLIRNSPKIRLRRENGFYIPDPNGQFLTSIWSAFFHLHVGYDQFDPTIITHLPPNMLYGVGCGTNRMEDMSTENAHRAEEMMLNGNIPLMFMWPVNRHGVIGGIPWGMPIEGKDGKYHQGLEAGLELIDPQSYGAVKIDPHNIPQFPQGNWPLK